MSAVASGCSTAGLRKAPFVLSRNHQAEASNVLVFMSDEHNPFFSSLGRHRFVETPNLERLAERGVVFANTYCPSPVCHPSRSAFCAGKRVHQLQTYSNCNLFKADFPSYGQVLAHAGVHTVNIGKTDFYNEAVRLGFSETISPGERLQPNPCISRQPLAINPGGALAAQQYGVDPANFEYDISRVDEAIHWLNETAPTLSQPWVCVVNGIRPHFPLKVSQDLWDKYQAHNDLPSYDGSVESAHHPYALDLRAHFQTDFFSEEQIRGLRQGYYGCVTFMDQQIGRLLAALEASGQSERTVFAYTSDHGEMLGKFGMWWKCSLYEDSARVPLIVAGPGFSKGQVVETPVDLLDLQATLFHATGHLQERPDAWIGTPLQEISSNNPNRVVFSEYHGHGTRASSYLIRKGDWKLHYCVAASHQLFNLAEDPEELHNQASAHPEKLSELEEELRSICNPIVENQRAEDYIQFQLAELDRRGLLPPPPEEPPLVDRGEIEWWV